MPLTMAELGVPRPIKRIGGRAETRQFLEDLGFVPGGQVSVLRRIAGNLIVEVKGARVAVNSALATKIIV